MSEKGGLYYSKKTFITAYVGWEVQWFQFKKKSPNFVFSRMMEQG